MKPYRPIALALFLFALTTHAQNSVNQTVKDYLSAYSLYGYKTALPITAESVKTDDDQCEISIVASEGFCAQPFTPELVDSIYSELQRRLSAPYNTYHLSIRNKNGQLIEDLVPNIYRTEGKDESRLWGKTNYDGQPWVENTSRPYRVTNGLNRRHIFIWPSHGRYFKDGKWQWQRPNLFCTTEDLYTQSFVFPYLFPMLERAGAVVGCPRERDYQTNEAVVDNDSADYQGKYAETPQEDATWESSADNTGFGMPTMPYTNSEHPFKNGTYRTIATVDRKTKLASATWMPDIPEAGRYAVYVSYATRANSVSDARYTVIHKGGRTNFTVNQQMGGGTWVYLGTFEFEKGTNSEGRVILTNQSAQRGVVTADAVRFGGGMGQTVRGSAGTTGIPRYLEAARYYAQWAGMSDSIYNGNDGSNDYSDDLTCRSRMLNHLAGGSVYMPDNGTGLHVPFELSLAVHSDAGYRTDNSVYGTLAISTPQDKDGVTAYPSGLSRSASSDFARLMLSTVTSDISRTFNTTWVQREHWERSYSESRLPRVPSAILETMSHQNFTDLRYGHDPLFKFAFSRAIYKSILRFVNSEHGNDNVTVQPLAPHAFAAVLSADGASAELSWQPTTDPIEPTATPTHYILYTRVDNEAFDNGLNIGAATTYSVPLRAGHIYAFRISAANDGGESFPSETLTTYRSEKDDAKRLLIVNGFTRLSGPAYVCNADSTGFLLDTDPGVPYISTTAYCGRQTDFNSRAAGKEGVGALGYSGSELVGKEIAGNTFDYPLTHGRAIVAASSDAYSFSSVSSEAFEQNSFNATSYAAIDYIAGLQADFSYNLKPFPVFTAAARNKLTAYLKNGGALMLSGSYIGTDCNRNAEGKDFIEDVLKFKLDGSARIDSTDYATGLKLNLPLCRKLSSTHYAALAPDAIMPTDSKAFIAIAYGGGQSAAVAYKGKHYRTISLGFPFECITDEAVRAKAMRAILKFLIK